MNSNHCIFASLLRSLLLAFVLASSAVAMAQSVVFLNPGKSNEKFWVSVTVMAQAAADDLGMPLEVLYAERERDAMISNARSIVRRPKHPDYLIVVNEKQVAAEILEITAGSSIKVFFLLNTMNPAEIEALANQGKSIDHLIGSLATNQEAAGYQMATALIAEGKRANLQGPDKKLHLFAINGDKVTPAAIEREIGLQRALAEHPEVVLSQVLYGEWNAERAEQQASVLFARYPQTRLVWAANDQMAFGAMKAARARGQTPGKTVLFSGLNNSPEAMQARADGSLSVLAAGHFAAGAWSMVMIHDLHAGKRLTGGGGAHRTEPMFELIDRKMAQRFLRSFGNNQRPAVNFKRYSLSENAELSHYRFSMLSLLGKP